jgi:dynein heavy chain, axonemal
MVAYAGPFTLAYRQELEGSWINMMKNLNFKHSDDVTMRNFLGVPVQIQGWNIAGLPKDDTSTENGFLY